VEIFRQVHRVLRSDGVLWLNIGDSYAGKANGGSTYDRHRGHGHRSKQGIVPPRINNTSAAPLKSLIGIPWRIAFALQADGWIIRNAITWNKPNAMPEAVKDRLSSRHEQLFLLTKEPSYWFDLDPIREPIANRTTAAADLEQLPGVADGKAVPLADERGTVGHDGRVKPYLDKPATVLGRNPGDVWTIPTAPYPAAHFATFPRELARRCILAGCPPQVCPSCGHLPQQQTHTAQHSTGRPTNGPRTVQRRHRSPGTAGYTTRTVAAHTTIGWTACDCGVSLTPGVVLDPFAGASTTLMVARQLMRNSIGIELSPDYCAQSAQRIGPAGFDFDAASRSSADMAQDTG